MADNPTTNVAFGKYNTDRERRRMKRSSNLRVFFWSIAISGLVNAFLLSSAFAGGAGDKKPLYVRLADLIAAPPGYIVNQVFAPKEHATGAFEAVTKVELERVLEKLELPFSPCPTRSNL
jgi:hypothetical protein